MVHASSDNLYGSETYIVDADAGKGSHTTIALAMADAVSGDIVALRPGTYTENFTLPAGVRLTSIGENIVGQMVKIIGKITYTGTGPAEISNIFLQTNGDYLIEVSGTNASRLRVHNCFLNVADNDGINFSNSNAASNIQFYSCESAQASTFKLINKTAGAGPITFNNSNLVNSGGTITASTCSAGTLSFQYCTVDFPITTSSSGTVNLLYSRIPMDSDNLKILNLTSSSGQSFIEHSIIESGSATAISVAAGHTCHLRRCIVSSDNASVTDGAGTLIYDLISFGGTSSTLSTSTLTALPTTPSLGGGGVVVQQVRASTSALFDLATAIPFDDTIPQQTEGDEILTVAITPTSASSVLVIEATAQGAIDQAERKLTMALFRDAGADAISATSLNCSMDTSVSDVAMSGSIKTYVSAGSTSATTFKIRCGDDSGAQSSVNGWDINRLYGGVSNTSLIVTEFSS